jgi:hypothetical protein
MTNLLAIGEVMLAIFLVVLWLKVDELTGDVRELSYLSRINASAGRAMRRIHSQRVRAEEQLRRIDDGW